MDGAGQPWRRRTWLEEGGVYPEGVEGTVGDAGRGMALSKEKRGTPNKFKRELYLD